MSELSYFDRRMRAIGVENPAEHCFSCEKDGQVYQKRFFTKDRDGNVLIHFPRLGGGELEYLAGSAPKPMVRKRLQHPKGDMKYVSPKGSGVPLFLTPEVLKRYAQKVPTETLYLTEGEFKAYAASEQGLPIIGLVGINSIQERDTGDKEQKAVAHDNTLLSLIATLGVKHIDYLLDSDCFDLSQNEDKDITIRPRNFINAIWRWKQHALDVLGVTCSFSYIKPVLGAGVKLGLDDLLTTYEDEQTPDMKSAIIAAYKEAVATGEETRFFGHHRLKGLTLKKLKALFHFDTAQALIRHHAHALKQRKYFYVNNKKVRLTEDELLEELEVESSLQEGERGWFAIRKDGGRREVSNFRARVLYMIRTTGEGARVVELENEHGIRKTVVLRTPELVELSKFRTRCEDLGNFRFPGTAKDLEEMKARLYREVPVAKTIETMGWHKDGFWAYSNGIYNGSFQPINEYGMVEHEKELYFLPAESSMMAELGGWDAERAIRFKQNDEADFQTWAGLLFAAFGQKTHLLLAFVVASVFRDMLYEQYDNFPLLALVGPPGTGKNTAGASVMKAFLTNEKPLGLGGGTTPKGIQRRFAGRQNVPVWLDEFKNHLPDKTIEMLKNLYDGLGYLRASFSNDNRTTGSDILATCMLSGQEIPVKDPALLTRCCLVMFDRTTHSRAPLDALRTYEANGLTGLSARIAQHRHVVKAEFKRYYADLSKLIAAQVPDVQLPERLRHNYALLLAPLYLLLDKGLLQYPKDLMPLDMIPEAVARLKDQLAYQATGSELETFWDIVEKLVASNYLHPGQHFRVESAATFAVDDAVGQLPKDQTIVVIHLKQVHLLYSEWHRKVHGRNGLDKATLMGYLQRTDYRPYLGQKKQIKFGGKNTNGWCFHVEALDINWEPSAEPSFSHQASAAEAQPEPDLPF